MSFLKKLFGGGKGQDGPQFEAVDHDGFTIYPEPIPEVGVFRVAARIEKLVDGELRSQSLVRADTANTIEVAAEIAILKACQVIDERGERVFEGPSA